MLKRIKSIFNAEDLLLFLLSYCLSLIGAYLFFNLQFWIFLLALVFAFFLKPSFSQVVEQRKERQARRSLMNFLQFLCSSLALGQALRKVLQEIGDSTYVRRSASKSLQIQLQRIALLIKNQQSAETYLPLLEAAFPCPETKALLYALRLEQQLGEKLLDMLRDSFDTARELVMLEDEIAAANNRQRAEAMILALLPFAMAPLFSGILNLSDASGGLAALLRFIAYILAMTAFFLNLRFSLSSRQVKGKNIEEPQFIRLYSDVTITRVPWLRTVFLKLPFRFRLRLLRLYRLAYPQYFYSLQTESDEAFLYQHIFTLLLIFCTSLLVMLILALSFSLPLFWPLLFALSFALLYDARLQSRAQEHEAALRKDLPLMLSLLARLLRNTMHLNSALRECLNIYAKQESPLATVVKTMTIRTAYAESTAEMFEQLAEQLQLSDIGSLLFTLSRYTKLGSRELLDILDKQLNLCWAEQRQNIRRKLDAKSGLSLVPMLLDLVAVMLIGIAPAMQIFMVF